MGIQINGQTDTISSSDGGLSVSGMDLSSVTSINASGIITATSANVGSGITLSGTQINVGSATTIHSGGFRIGSSDLHSAGLSIASLNLSGISTFSSGPVLIGTGSSTGTSSQPLQVTGGAYVSGSLGVGKTNPPVSPILHTGGMLMDDDGGYYGGQAYYNGGWRNSVSNQGGYAIRNTGGNFTIFTGPSPGAANSFFTTFSEKLRIDGGGNVLIGTSSSTGTSSQRLQVTGGAYVSGNLGIGTTNPSSSLHVAGSRDNTPTQPGVHIGEGGGNDFAIDICCRTSSSNSYVDFTYPGQDYKGRIIKTMGSAFSIQNTEATNMTLYNNGDNAIIIDSARRITMPSQVYVYAGSSTVSGTPNPVSPPHYPFTTYSESYDVGSNFNATTGVFTAPITGKYLIMGTWSQDATVSRSIGTLSFNGNYEEWAESNNAYNDVTGTKIRVLAANDTVSFGRQGNLTSIVISIWLLG